MDFVSLIVPPTERNGYALLYIFFQNGLLVKQDAEGYAIPRNGEISLSDFVIERDIYLGKAEGEDVYAISAGPSAVPEGFSIVPLRTLYTTLPEQEVNLAGRASQILEWDRTHRFCGVCGTPTVNKANERAKLCPACGHISFPRISPAVIVAVIRDGKILLAHNRNFKPHMFSLIAGFVDPGESLEDCVKREVLEEVSISVCNIRYFGSQSWPFPHSMMVGFTAEYESGEIRPDGVEIQEASWFKAGELPQIPPRGSISRRIIDWFLRTYA